jgi:hypothetical protein
MKHILPVFFVLLFACTLSTQTSYATPPYYDLSGDEDRVEVKIYPNPATDFIALTDISNVKKITIYNLLGRQMKTFVCHNVDEKHYVGDLPRGMYLVQIISNKDKIIKTQRVNKR